MRIAIICPYNLDLPGGVQSQALEMARALQEVAEVTLIGPGTAIPEALAGSKVETVMLGKTFAFPANGSVAPISLSFSTLRRLREALRRLKPDVLIIHEPLVPIVSIAALLGAPALRLGVFHRAGKTRALRLLHPIAKRLLERIDIGIVVSEEARASATALVGDRSRTFLHLPNAVKVDRFSSGANALHRPSSILFLGRHESRKGLAVLLEAFSLLPESFALEVAGAGPQTAQLRQRYGDQGRIRWLGRLGDQQLVEAYARAEIFVAPSLGGESFGVVLLEAMAAEVAVVCSDISGYRLAAGEAARYVTPGDAGALSRAIEELSADSEQRELLVVRGRARSREFDISTLSRRYLDEIHRARPDLR